VTYRFGLIVGGQDGRSVQYRMDDKAAPAYRKDIKADLDTGTPLDCLWLKDPSKWYMQWAYVAASDNTVKVYKFDGQKLDLTDTLGGHSDWVYGLAASADGKRLASASGDGSVKLWNLADRSLLATLVQLSPGTDDWLIVTAQGYFATSNPAAVQGETNGFQNAKIVRQTLAAVKAPRK
jgi:WD40 repeat protein